LIFLLIATLLVSLAMRGKITINLCGSDAPLPHDVLWPQVAFYEQCQGVLAPWIFWACNIVVF